MKYRIAKALRGYFVQVLEESKYSKQPVSTALITNEHILKCGKVAAAWLPTEHCITYRNGISILHFDMLLFSCLTSGFLFPVFSAVPNLVRNLLCTSSRLSQEIHLLKNC